METGGAMAEVGLLPFARIALQVSRAVLPRYRSRFSKRQFTQPQLLAILCLMRYEDWTFREAEGRLSEHRELRQGSGLRELPGGRGSGFPPSRHGAVLADAECDSERNHTYIRKRLGAQSVIPAKRGKKTWRVHGVRAEMRRAFPQRIYRRRALIESLFSSVKRKLTAREPGRTHRTQVRHALLLALRFNPYRVEPRPPF